MRNILLLCLGASFVLGESEITRSEEDIKTTIATWAQASKKIDVLEEQLSRQQEKLQNTVAELDMMEKNPIFPEAARSKSGKKAIDNLCYIIENTERKIGEIEARLETGYEQVNRIEEESNLVRRTKAIKAPNESYRAGSWISSCLPISKIFKAMRGLLRSSNNN